MCFQGVDISSISVVHPAQAGGGGPPLLWHPQHLHLLHQPKVKKHLTKESGSNFTFLQHQPWWIWVQQKLWQNVAKGTIDNMVIKQIVRLVIHGYQQMSKIGNMVINKLWASTFMILMTDSKPARWPLSRSWSKQELGAPLGRQGPPSSSHILSTWSNCHPINHHHCTMR